VHAHYKDKVVDVFKRVIMRDMKMYYSESRSRGITYMKYVNGRRTGLVTFCVETAFYNRLLKER